MRYRVVKLKDGTGKDKKEPVFEVVNELSVNSSNNIVQLVGCNESTFILEVESETYVYFKKDTCKWLEIKRREYYELNEIEEKNKYYFKFYFDFYVNNNFSTSSRACYVNFSNYNEVQDFMLSQEPCEFKVDLMGTNIGNIEKSKETDKFDYEIKLNSEVENHTMLYFRAVGGNRKLLFNEYCFDLIEKREINDKNLEFFRPFDYGIGYTIEQDKTVINERFNKFCIDLFYVGKSNAYTYEKGDDDYVKNFYYMLTIRHSNDINTKLRFKIYIPNPKVVPTENIEESLEPNYNWIQEKNNENRDAETDLKPAMASFDEIVALMDENPVILVDSISDIVVSGDTITLQTNVVNRFGDVEHDSAVVLRSTGTWCSGNDNFDYDNEKHVIKIVGSENIYGSDRTCMLTIMNAERTDGKKNFLVKQDKEGNVMIEEN